MWAAKGGESAAGVGELPRGSLQRWRSGAVMPFVEAKAPASSKDTEKEGDRQAEESPRGAYSAPTKGYDVECIGRRAYL